MMLKTWLKDYNWFSFANRTGVVIPECLTSKANAGRPAFWNWSAAQPSPSVHPALCSTSRSSTSDGHVGCDSESPIPKRRRVSEPRPSVISGPSADLSVGSASNLVDYSSNPPPSELESQSYSEVMNSSMDNTNDDSFMTACSSQEANETNINSSLEEIPEVENEPESNSCEKVLTATVKEGPTAVPSPSIDPETDDECAIVEEVPKNEASSRLNNSPLDVITDQTSSKRLTHECYICKKKFLTKLSLTDHIQTHAHDAGNTVEEVLPIPVNQTVYVCRICSIAYSSRDMYQQHFSRHNDFYSCPLCSSIAFSRDQMNQHTKAHAAGLAFGCSICFKAMRSEFSLHMHLGFTHRIAMIWICKSCGYGHRDINVAVGHIQVAHRDQLTGPSDKVTQIRSLLGVCAHRKLHYQVSGNF